jgi:hypothetical protein
MNRKVTLFLIATALLGMNANATPSNWSKLMDAKTMNFDFIAPVVMDDTVPPKQAGSIFFNAATAEFQGFDLLGNTVTLGGSSGSGSTTSTEWTAYTPTFSGFGSPTNISFFWRRMGDTLEVKGTFTAGTVTSNLGSLTLPNALTIDSAKISLATTTGTNCPKYGNSTQATANRVYPMLVCTSTSTSLVYTGKSTNSANFLTPNTVDLEYGSSEITTFEFAVPISGWTNNN